ncbi:MAG: hypothetical protein ACXV8Q_03360 [Methylobacter sp.]
MKKIVCGPENVTDFNRQIKSVAPEFHNLAKQLHAAGLITGLRGATLEIGDFSEPSEPETPKQESPKHCEECGLWVRDTIGFGAGIGECLIDSRPTLLKWPKQTACHLFEVKI